IPSFSLMGFPPNQAPFQSLSTNTNNRLPNSNSQLNNGSSAPTNNTSSQPSSTNGLPQNFPSVRFSSHPRSLPTSSNPDFIRFQQIMQRPQTFFHQFGSHSPFFTNNVSPPPALR
ncbi:7740_t:CDS:2, partial [Entrophospora sp. SA101]